MAGRGGRGAALMEALLAMQRQPGERSGETVNAQEEESAPSTSVAPLSVGAGRGRAALFANFASQRSQVGEPASVAAEEPQPSTSGGRGRAQLFQALSRGRGVPEPVGSKSPPGRQAPIKGSSPKAIEQLSTQVENVSLQEKPPVHRTGESGKRPIGRSKRRWEDNIKMDLAEIGIEESNWIELTHDRVELQAFVNIQATANYVRLFLEPGKGVFEYEVRFNPEVDSQSIRYKMLGQHVQALGGTKTFDGVTLYLPIKLQNQETNFISTHPVDGSNYTLKIIFKRQKRLGECTHLYNVLFRRIMLELNLVLIGRQHFSPANAHQIPQHKLEVWPGYVTAVDEYEGGIQLCCDASHRVLRTQTVHEVMEEMVHYDKRNYQNLVQKAIIGECVLTRYNNRIYRVDDVDWSQNPSSTFISSSGNKMSYRDYYEKQYGITIRNLEQPLLLNRMKKKIRGKETQEQMICLVPELCFVTGLTDAMRSDFRVMKDIAMYTRITPNQRQYALKKFVSNIQNCEKALNMLAGWGLSLDPSTVSIAARIVDPENIFFGNNAIHQGTPQADWGSALSRYNVLTVVDLQRWLVVHSQRDARIAKDFIGAMSRVGPQMGITVCKPNVECLKDDRTDSYLNTLRENIKGSLQIVVIIFPTARDDRYSAVKKLCCADMPIASQVINSRTLSKQERLRSVVQKIALQINCKLGGTLWAVKIPMEKLMICGIDSYHEASKRGSSVAAFVASTNQSLTRWYSKACFQGPGQELVDGLKTCFIGALNVYYQENHYFPERIVIYRDGVGDGQLRVSAEYEVPQFESCFQHVGPDYHPKLTVVICQKRINTRIFADLKGGGDGSLENPPPGTIVDHTITRRNWYDFFLVSQHVRQGTVSPTHYVVIHDNCNMKTDHLQRLTYKLCHLYYNWPGTIRVPAPCQYAHKLAQLVGQNIRRPPSELLAHRLFYL